MHGLRVGEICAENNLAISKMRKVNLVFKKDTLSVL